ncbi:MAG: hypothetical protein AB7V16_13975 [Vulcanibacillus sp.]
MHKNLLLFFILLICTIVFITGCSNKQPVVGNSDISADEINAQIASILNELAKEEKPVDVERDNEVNEENSESSFEDRTLRKSDYELVDGEIADFFSYNYKDRSMYIAGLKIFDEFSTSNEGSVSINTNENILIFSMTKATGSVTGALDGPHVYFKIDLSTNEIIDKQFTPAPNYAELGKTEYIQHSEEVIELSDERMIEIGVYFRDLILEIEAN